MRIIHGSHSGRRIHIPKNFKARPTTDQAREALFNILLNRLDFPDIKALDLFSGTGSISYEMASLGCSMITAIEFDRTHARLIQTNAENLGFDGISVIRTDAFHYIEKSVDQFDLIFADPPFSMPNLNLLPDKLLTSELLVEGGLLILEHGPQNDFVQHTAFKEVRKYGKVRFSFFSI